MHQLDLQRTASLHRVIPPHPVEPEQIVVWNPVGIGKNFCNLRMVLFYRIGSCCGTVESNSGLIRFMVVIGIPVGSLSAVPPGRRPVVMPLGIEMGQTER